MKPGDLIEWTHVNSDDVVDHDEIVWSSSMNNFAVIGGKVHILISYIDGIITWLNDEGMFHCAIDQCMIEEGLVRPRTVQTNDPMG